MSHYCAFITCAEGVVLFYAYKGKAVVAVMQRIQRNMVAPPQKTDAIMIHGDFRQPLEIISQYEAK